MRFSIDTNVFVYMADDRDLRRQEAGHDLVQHLLERDTWVSLQVVGELQNALVRRLKKTPAEAASAASFAFGAFPSFSYAEDDVSSALVTSATGRLSYWDALLLVSARRAGCELMFSEDMQDGGDYDGLRVVNPFDPLRDLSPAAREALGL